MRIRFFWALPLLMGYSGCDQTGDQAALLAPTNGGGTAGAGGGSPAGSGGVPGDSSMGGAAGEGGPGGGASGAMVGKDLPCDVDKFLSKRCRLCHAEPPKHGATVPLVTYENLLAPSFSDPGTTT
ncbi:MAG: hypothetical protein RMJ98_14550, partial [Myxococcales bacterium]|nr:hypothetical protein [Polyangiaceae bacterium]MDW8250512.1 hypothetical protein [Myxococcales bacterium]